MCAACSARSRTDRHLFTLLLKKPVPLGPVFSCPHSISGGLTLRGGSAPCKPMDISRISASLEGAEDAADLPVEKWHPTLCGEMDLVIREDGAWVHEGTPIGRPALVRLLSRVLRNDEDGYVLVTPVEKISIEVEDVPFLIVDIDREGELLRARTNVGDEALIGPDHPLEMRAGDDADDAPRPYVRIRGDLWARFARPAYYRLINEESWEKDGSLYISSAGLDYELGAVT